MPKKKRQKRTAEPRLHETTIIVNLETPFGDKEKLEATMETIRDRAHSLRAKLEFSEDGHTAKITAWGNIAQINNLESLTRASGAKTISDESPMDKLARLIAYYHEGYWHHPDSQDEACHLSCLAAAIGARQCTLDFPYPREADEVSKQGNQLVEAVEKTGLFAHLGNNGAMVFYSYIGGYMTQKVTCEHDHMKDVVRMKAMLLGWEDEGCPDFNLYALTTAIQKAVKRAGKANAMQMLTREF